VQCWIEPRFPAPALDFCASLLLVQSAAPHLTQSHLNDILSRAEGDKSVALKACSWQHTIDAPVMLSVKGSVAPSLAEEMLESISVSLQGT
jgi:hypothetical protein